MLARIPPAAAHAGGGSAATALLVALLRAIGAPPAPPPVAGAGPRVEAPVELSDDELDLDDLVGDRQFRLGVLIGFSASAILDILVWIRGLARGVVGHLARAGPLTPPARAEQRHPALAYARW